MGTGARTKGVPESVSQRMRRLASRRMQRLAPHPPGPPFARGGPPSTERIVISQRATKTRDARPRAALQNPRRITTLISPIASRESFEKTVPRIASPVDKPPRRAVLMMGRRTSRRPEVAERGDSTHEPESRDNSRTSRNEAGEVPSRSSSGTFPASLGQRRASARRNVWETRLKTDAVPRSWYRSRVSP